MSPREVCTYPCLFVESWKTAFCYIHTIKATEKVELCVPCLLLERLYETKEIVCSSLQMCFGMRIYGYHELLWPPPSLPVASICCRRSLYLLVCYLVTLCLVNEDTHASPTIYPRCHFLKNTIDMSCFYIQLYTLLQTL